jgi:hypothetical protein
MATQKWVLISICLLALLGFVAIGLSFFQQIGCEGQLAIASFKPVSGQEIRGEQVIGQSFVAPHNHLYRIEVHLQTYQRQNTQDISFKLFELPEAGNNPNEGREIFNTTFNASSVRDRVWYRFEIPAIPDSAQRTYFFVLSSPTSKPGDTIAVGGVQKDIYQPGTAYLGAMPVPADIAFRTCYRMSSVEKLQILREQITRHRPGLWGKPYFYVILIFIYFLLLTSFFWRLNKLKL